VHDCFISKLGVPIPTPDEDEDDQELQDEVNELDEETVYVHDKRLTGKVRTKSVGFPQN